MGGKLQHLMSRLHLAKGGGGRGGVAVPRGHFAVYVGESRARFVIPTAYLRHPAFVALLESAEEEFGFDHHGGSAGGGITIPCSESDFVELVGSMSSSSPSSWRH